MLTHLNNGARYKITGTRRSKAPVMTIRVTCGNRWTADFEYHIAREGWTAVCKTYISVRVSHVAFKPASVLFCFLFTQADNPREKFRQQWSWIISFSREIKITYLKLIDSSSTVRSQMIPTWCHCDADNTSYRTDIKQRDAAVNYSRVTNL